MHLSEKTIRTLPVPSKGNKIAYDDQVKGFGLRTTAAAARAFILNYRADGRERRLTIGPWPEWSATAARERAKELRRQVDVGSDPLADREARRGEPTFGELVADYLDREGKKQKSFREYKRILEKDALPKWRSVRVVDIRRRDVIALIEEKAQDAPIAANRLFELVRRVFNYAIRRDVVDANPCAQVKKPGEERSKDRVLGREELRALWSALDGPNFTVSTASALRLILLTGQRPGEVLGMRWEDVDLEAGLWTIPGDRAKNGLSHRVPLNESALAILKATPPVASWVFPSHVGDQPVHRNALALALRRARSEEKRSDRLRIAPFTPHDLRRTAASGMASAGIPRFVVGRVLNHVEPGVTRVYDRHGYDAEKRGALETWDRALRAIVTGDEMSKVVSIR